MKKLILLATALLAGGILLLGAAPSAQAARWAEPYLQNLVDREIMKGDKDGSLNPDRLITRAEFAALVNRAFGFTAQSNKTFSDVKPTSWYAADISIAANQGYMVGNGKGANPTGNLTREEAVAMLCRALKIPEVKQEEFTLNDEKTFSNWSRGYINAALDRSFVNGYPDSTFRPKNYITRGEAAKMLSDVGGEIVNKTNNNAHGTINGNLTIASSGVTISDTTIMGDVFLTEGVGLGYVHLNNVSINGELIISGAGESNVGESSVTLSDCTITDLTVDVAKLKILTLKTDRSTTVRNAMIKSSAYLEELTDNYEGFDRVTLNGPSGTFLNLSGNFGDVRIMSPEAKLGLYKGQANGITVDETAKNAKIFLEKDTITEAIYFDTGAAVTGTGRIRNVLINNDGVTIDQLPDNIYIRPGVTAKINGKVMGSLDAENEALNPEFMAGYPMADKIQPTSFNEYYKTNKAGKIYYALYAADMPAPSKDDLIAKNNPPKNALKSGNLSSLPDKESTVAFSGLKAGNKYVVYSLFVDLRNKTSNIERTNVETVDNIVPTLLSGYPKVQETDKNSVTIELIPNKDTHYYWAVMPNKAVAPTVEQLYTQKMSGDMGHGIDKSGAMNKINTIKVEGLKEFQTYTFYVILRDTAENMSKTAYKLPFTTKDATPPTFIPLGELPKTGVITDTSIPLEYMVSEPCTVYWAAAKEGTEFLPKDANGKEDILSDNAKNLVKGGIKANKFGKATASKENTKSTISISGLEKQMPYSIYFVLEDKNGNSSNILKMSAKTKDTIAPTATLSSAQMIDGKFSVESPVTMIFSEIVCSANKTASGDYIPFSQIPKDELQLESYIRLMDSTKVPVEKVKIDWSKVTVKDVDAKTEITFPPEAFIHDSLTKPSLANNNSYYFELVHDGNYLIRDTSKNQMQLRTQLKFQTVPPLTYFSEVNNFDTEDYNTVFYIKPDGKSTGSNIYFDIMVRTNHNIKFDFYASSNLDAMGAAMPCSILADQATPLLKTVNKRITYASMENTYYAIKLTEIDGKPLEESKIPLTAEIDLTMTAAIGNTNKLNELAVPANQFSAKLKDYVSRGDISVVTAPKDPFDLRVVLLDNVPPDVAKIPGIENPQFTLGDIQTVMKIWTTKDCTVYYLAMPKSEAPPVEPIHSEIRNAKSNPNLGISAGSFAVTNSGGGATQHTITGLLPPEDTASEGAKRDYVVYYYMKGDAPEPSEVKPDSFETVQVTSPEFMMLRYIPGVRSIDIKAQLSQPCTVYYVLYPKGTFGTSSTTLPTVDQIMNPTKGPSLIASGSFDVKNAGDTVIQTITNQAGLEYTTKYSFYAVAQRYIGTPPTPQGAPSKIGVLATVTPRDTDPPAISNGKADYLQPRVTVVGGTHRYSGEVTVTFTEALYYFEQGESEPRPLKKDDFKFTHMSGGVVTLSGATEDSVPILGEDGEPKPGQTEQCLRSVTFKYTNITPGATIQFAKTVGDRALNYAGTFHLSFAVPTLGDPSTAEWTAKFVPAKP